MNGYYTFIRPCSANTVCYNHSAYTHKRRCGHGGRIIWELYSPPADWCLLHGLLPTESRFTHILPTFCKYQQCNGQVEADTLHCVYYCTHQYSGGGSVVTTADTTVWPTGHQGEVSMAGDRCWWREGWSCHMGDWSHSCLCVTWGKWDIKN